MSLRILSAAAVAPEAEPEPAAPARPVDDFGDDFEDDDFAEEWDEPDTAPVSKPQAAAEPRERPDSADETDREATALADRVERGSFRLLSWAGLAPPVGASAVDLGVACMWSVRSSY